MLNHKLFISLQRSAWTFYQQNETATEQCGEGKYGQTEHQAYYRHSFGPVVESVDLMRHQSSVITGKHS
jgi:hypothetical protein